MGCLEALKQRIASKKAVVGVIGLGYVGLPLALVFEEVGFPVLGFDVDPKKPEALHKGESYVKHVGPDRIADAFKHGRIQATTNFSRLCECDTILICVPTPLGRHREPDPSTTVLKTLTRRSRYGSVPHGQNYWLCGVAG
jgi:UDP-N-acetyl-D-glucosamine dehydrogenase